MAATGVHDRTGMPCDFINLDSRAGREYAHGKEQSNLTEPR
jgi:hypothetical protein